MERIAYTAEEFAGLLSAGKDDQPATKRDVWNLIATGQVPYLRIAPRCVRIPVSAVDYAHGSPMVELDGLGTIFQMLRGRVELRVSDVAEALGTCQETLLRNGLESYREDDFVGAPHYVYRAALQIFLLDARARAEGERREIDDARGRATSSGRTDLTPKRLR